MLIVHPCGLLALIKLPLACGESGNPHLLAILPDLEHWSLSVVISVYCFLDVESLPSEAGFPSHCLGLLWRFLGPLEGQGKPGHGGSRLRKKA